MNKPPKNYLGIGHSTRGHHIVHDVWWFDPKTGICIRNDKKNKGHVNIGCIPDISGRIDHSRKLISIAGIMQSETQFRGVVKYMQDHFPEYEIYSTCHHIGDDYSFTKIEKEDSYE